MKRKETIEITVIVIFVIVLLINVPNIFKKDKVVPKAKTKVSIPASGKTQETKIRSVSPEEIFKRLGNKAKSLKWTRDPFVHSSNSVVTRNLKLVGIVWDGEESRALIGDAIIRIGDKIGGNTVVDIKKERVILNDGAELFELKLQ